MVSDQDPYDDDDNDNYLYKFQTRVLKEIYTICFHIDQQERHINNNKKQMTNK
jgi:hypothetical protein